MHTTRRRIWLITNAASGSATPAMLTDLDLQLRDAGLRIAQHSTFPARELPSPAVLDAAEVDLVAIFAGDGTINAALTTLSGWSGAVLVLPGGTMNLLHQRLFGEASVVETLDAVASGLAGRCLPKIISSPLGLTFAGLLAGPGTAWNDVREALRGADLASLPGDIGEALTHSLSGPMIHCAEPPLGRAEGYPLLLATPLADGIELKAYFAETPVDYLAQGLALARRDFRLGPHELLGTATRLVLAGDRSEEDGGGSGAGFGILLDGEPVWADGPTEFTLVQSPVDLLATETDGP